MTVVITKPGVYRDLAEADYHNDETVPGGSLSCSGAKLLLPPSCPAVFAWRRKHPAPSTEAMELGSAAHREVLGKGWAYDVWPGTSWSEKGAKAFQEEARAAGRIPIKAAQHEQIKAMAAAIRAHPAASLLLQAEEVLNEVSLFWRDPEWGFWRRSRMDAARLPGRVLIVDYKSAVSADETQFAKQAGNLNYHMQDAYYRAAVTQTLGDSAPAFIFVVQEKTEPYLVGIYELDQASRWAGEAKVEQALRVYARCVETGQWGGYQEDGKLVTKISLPRWAL